MSFENPGGLRADAARNRAAIIEAAGAVFRRDGAAASLEEIARVAKVGSATLHRRFPSRQSLLDAVFLDDVIRLCDEGREIASTVPAAEALWHWLGRVAVHCAADDALSKLIRGGAATATSRGESFALLQETGETLMQSAVTAGSARADIPIGELLLLVNAIADAAAGAGGDVLRLLAVIREGAKPR
ncbi:helix-turn-helix domain-containing protein [Streptomyces sp. NPDC048281]|uniref:TetR/AcrR family transcriptional regulator n=1 Tax=Streptomyces sp. NPDC048281 TaxID=3154715 RepID=UPI00343D74DE